MDAKKNQCKHLQNLHGKVKLNFHCKSDVQTNILMQKMYCKKAWTKKNSNIELNKIIKLNSNRKKYKHRQEKKTQKIRIIFYLNKKKLCQLSTRKVPNSEH